MGLQEKRALKLFQETNYQKLTEEINTIAGFILEFEVDWQSIALDDYSHLYETAFSKLFFIPIIEAFKQITIDDLGKECLKETVKKIIIKNQEGVSSANMGFSFEKGTLVIDHLPFTNIDEVEYRSEELAKFLMKQM